MGAYVAVLALKEGFSRVLHYYDVVLPPEHLKMYERATKELKSFLDFVERLDGRSRKRMGASLGRVEQAVDEVGQRFSMDGTTDDQIAQLIPPLLHTLKKTQDEYYSFLEHVDEASSSSKMIGLRDERMKLKESLLNDHFVEATVHLLSGMAGIGKTTLAREVYQDLDISEWYECRAWVTLGHEWKSDEITKSILAQVDPDASMGGDEEEIAQRLKQRLKLGKRCLIVVDDVWDHYDFSRYMQEILLDNLKSSRLLLTSRIKGSLYSDQFFLFDLWHHFEKRLLNEKESWDLLRDKVFCPPQLERVGKKIARKCDGLPLTIITVAHLLSKLDQSLWIDVAEKRKHQVFVDAYDQISEVLYPSYKELHDALKLCFLYMGVFPLKYEMHRSKLFNLWTAEGIFHQFLEGETPYRTFLYSIQHLNDCSLVMVYERSTTHSMLSPAPSQAIRTCGLHSSWWHFCQREARKSNFFYALDCYEDGLEESLKRQTRLSIQNNVLFALKDVHNSIEENCAFNVKSLLCFGPYNQYMVPICFGLKLLQRLDALNIRFYDFPLEVLELAKLVYLALTCNRQLPTSISKLEKLQYLIVHPHLSIKSSSAPTYMPIEIWDLKELEYLQVLGSDLPDPVDKSKSLGMLSTLLDVSSASCTIVNKLPNLKNVRIRIELTPDTVDPLGFSHHILSLKKVESVNLMVVNPGCKFEVVPSFPYQIKELSLSGLGYPWEEMRGIASLKCLQVLKLQCNAFSGNIWGVEMFGFPVLYSLEIEDLDLVKLVGEEGSFKYLSELSIKHCYKMEEIQLGDNKMLGMVQVVDSNPRVEKSIREAMLQMDPYPLHFSVHHSWESA